MRHNQINLIKDFLRFLISYILGRPLRFSWVINNKLAWSSRIYSSREIWWLKKRRITAMLNLTEKPISEELVKRHGLNYLHVSIPDHKPPTLEQIERCIDFIRLNLVQQKPVVVFCSIGKGRSGTIIVAYLIQVHGFSLKEALRIARSIRPGSVEPEQELALKRYCSHLSKDEN